MPIAPYTPVSAILGNDEGAAVLVRYLPGLTASPNLEYIRPQALHEFIGRP